MCFEVPLLILFTSRRVWEFAEVKFVHLHQKCFGFVPPVSLPVFLENEMHMGS